MDERAVAAWLDGYSHAWGTYDPAEIGALFSTDAVYFYDPFHEPVRAAGEAGRRRVVGLGEQPLGRVRLAAHGGDQAESSSLGFCMYHSRNSTQRPSASKRSRNRLSYSSATVPSVSK